MRKLTQSMKIFTFDMNLWNNYPLKIRKVKLQNEYDLSYLNILKVAHNSIQKQFDFSV